MTGVAAAAICLGLASCSRFDYTLISEGEQAYVNYENAFIEKFGEPAPDQTWGFGSADANSGASRAITRTASPNANMWGSDWYVPQPLTNAQKDIVRRYFQQNKNPQGTAINYTNFFVQDVYKGGTNVTSDSQTTETYKAANGDVIVGSNKMDKLSAG